MKKIFALLLLFFLIGSDLLAQEKKKILPAELEIPLEYGAHHLGKRQDAAMQRFRDNRLGLFIHWGLYSITGGEWNGKVYKGSVGFLQKWAKISPQEWRSTLMPQWNPAKFNADEWVKLAKGMGVKYIKITTKHHEGFCLWPSKYSKFTVEYTPNKRDVLGELVKACDAQGIDVHFYYSILDWSHPDYRSSIKNEADSAAFVRYLQFAENQLKELVARYPSVKDFWFDGTWKSSFKKNGWWSDYIEKELKRILPGVTVNSRLRADDYGKRHFDSNGHLMGDYESGYERRLPDPIKDLYITRHDWEAYMTLPENQWGYRYDWSFSYVKTPYEVIQRIAHAVSMGGNMVVNFGPKPDGTFRQEELSLAKVLGDWMKKYGKAIYGCGYAGLAKQEWGYYTKGKQGEIYMIVFNAPYSGLLTVKLPKDMKIKKATLLNGGDEINVVETTRDEFNVSMPKQNPNEPFVIRLDMMEESDAKDKYIDALT